MLKVQNIQSENKIAQYEKVDMERQIAMAETQTTMEATGSKNEQLSYEITEIQKIVDEQPYSKFNLKMIKDETKDYEAEIKEYQQRMKQIDEANETKKR